MGPHHAVTHAVRQAAPGRGISWSPRTVPSVTNCGGGEDGRVPSVLLRVNVHLIHSWKYLLKFSSKPGAM